MPSLPRLARHLGPGSERDAAPSPIAAAAVQPGDMPDRVFRALVGAAARDRATRAYFAAILDAQGLPPEESASIWRSFLAAAAEVPTTSFVRFMR